MPFDAKIYRILLASPSDVSEERSLARKLIHRWNSDFSQRANVVMLPLSCRTDVIPEMGDRPQGIVNSQIVDKADILIGIFWTRLGTPTGVAPSGSVEEIQRCSDAGKKVALFFSSRAIAPENVDATQYEYLKDFRRRCEASGYIETFRTKEEFSNKIRRFLFATGQQLAGHPLVPIALPNGQVPGDVWQVFSNGASGWGPEVVTTPPHIGKTHE